METAELSSAARTVQLEYARFRMLVESEAMGVESPGVEFWLLGLLHLASINDYRLDLFATPQVGWQDKLEARAAVIEELSRCGVEATAFGSILRTMLARGAESDPQLAEGYLRAEDPLRAILDEPTGTIALALVRHRLCTVLEHYRDGLRSQGEAPREKPEAPGSQDRQQDAYHILLTSEGEHPLVELLGLVHDPQLLRDLALHANLDFVRMLALSILLESQQLGGPQDQRLLEEIILTTQFEQLVKFAQICLDQLPPDPMPAPPAQRHVVRKSMRKSVLNPGLEELCERGWLDPRDPDDLDLIDYLYHVRNCRQFADLLPAERRRRKGNDHLRTSHLMVKEYDLDVLEEYVLYGDDETLRAFSFCRLIGWAHWEDNDEYSHLSYACGRAPGYTLERTAHLCAELQEQLGSYPPPYEPWYPMDPRDVLREGAYVTAEHLRYGRNFASELSYVGLIAREEASPLGIEREGIEFWLLGILRFAQLREDELRSAYPFRDIRESAKDAEQCRELLARHGLGTPRFEPLLRGTLVHGAPGVSATDPALLPTYFDAAKRKVDWRWDPARATELLTVILEYPSEAICMTFARLNLITMLEARLPPELRNTPKIPYKPTLFSNDSKLEVADLSAVDFMGVTDLDEMFEWCGRLRSVDLSPLAGLPITSMNYLFGKCHSLAELDLSPLDTSHVTSMEGTFKGCSSLTSLDLTPLDTSQVTNMAVMLGECSNLRTIDLSPLDTSQVTTMHGLFWRCGSLRSIDLSHFDTRHVRSMNSLFESCRSLESVDLSGFDSSQVTDMGEMFMDCSALTELDLAPLDTSQVTNMSHMFCGCRSLRRIDLSGFDTSRVTRIDGLFMNCDILEEVVGMACLDLSKVSDLNYLFHDCCSLRSVDLGDLDLSSAEDSRDAFSGCTSLVSWRLPATWPGRWVSSFPTSPRDDEKWWAVGAGAWMDVYEIAQRLRDGIVDTYTSEPR